MVAVPPSDDVEEAPPVPEPLGPLREFTAAEWQRIRNAQRFVQNASRRRALSASFINGMIWVETGFEARARGRRGPRGMLQLMPRTGRAMARKLNRKYMPESADFSIAAGTEYVMVMYERFDRDLQLALAAYNAGPAVVTAWQEAGSPAPKPRQSYFTRVERAAHAFCERLPQPRYEPDDSPFQCAALEPQAKWRARGPWLSYAPSPAVAPGRADGQRNQVADRRQRGDVSAAGGVGRPARDVAGALASGRR